MLSYGSVVLKDRNRVGRRFQDTRKFLDNLFSDDLHAKRIDSLANATLGVMTSASLAVSMIGQALAQARGLSTKHAVKQVDRLLSNQGIVVWETFAHWVPQVVGARTDIVVAMDWTEFAADGQATLALSLVTGHGRAMPLLWRTVRKAALKDARNDYEDQCLVLVIVARVLQRGFADRAPQQRRRPPVAGHQAQGQGRLAIGSELGPVHGHDDVGARADDLRNPVGEGLPDHDALIAQQPVHLLDRVLGRQPPRLGQGLTDHRDRERGTGHDPERCIGQRVNPLRMEVIAEQVVEELSCVLKPEANPISIFQHHISR